MADPEQVYQEVLQEEQQKGVSASVAEARAKAARARAEHGSPYPKEARWWPGAQPHLGDGGAAAEAPAAKAAVEAPAAEAQPAATASADATASPAVAPPAAPAEAPSAHAPAAEAQPAASRAEAPVAEAAPRPSAEAPPQPSVQAPAEPATPATQPAAEAPAQPATASPDAASEQPAPPVAASQQAPAPAASEGRQRPKGVAHGTTTGTRVRPEDEVATEAQFEGQAALYDRRQLIDELVRSGVPEAAVGDARPRARSFWLGVLYLAIPLIAILILSGQAQEGGGGGEEQGQGGGGGGGLTITAQSVQFDTKELKLPADQETTLTFENKDSVLHNVAIYETEQAQKDLFKGQNINGGESTQYKIPPIPAGNYFFRCDVHPTSMTGRVVVG